MSSDAMENALDAIVRRAMNDPAFRPQFYRDFLEFNLYAVGEAVGDFEKTSDGILTAGTRTSLRLNVYPMNGKKEVPVFSSLEKLQSVFGGEANFIGANARMILQVIPGDVEVVLNPGSTVSKRFVGAEIRQMLDGSIFKTPESHVIAQDQKVILGQPAQFPHKTVNALISYFESTPCIEKGYLAEISVPDRQEPPHGIIGIEISKESGKNFEQILSEIAIIINTAAPTGQFFDLIEVPGRGGMIVDYLLRKTQPFYIR